MCLPILVTMTPAPCSFASFIMISPMMRELLSSRLTDRFICKNEIERLAEGTHHRYTLLLTERHLPYLGIHLIGDTKHIKPLQNLLAALETGNLVPDLYILHRRKLWKETEFLKRDD